MAGEYPKRVWEPETGDFIDAAGPQEVPAGWLLRHPLDPAHADGWLLANPEDTPPTFSHDEVAPAAEPEPLDRVSILAILRERGVTFNSRASTAALAELLR